MFLFKVFQGVFNTLTEEWRKVVNDVKLFFGGCASFFSRF